jgi:hypothetical protein
MLSILYNVPDNGLHKWSFFERTIKILEKEEDVCVSHIVLQLTRNLSGTFDLVQVVGSADVLGNPIHFVRTLGSGMWDFVSTPARSLKQVRAITVHLFWSICDSL